MIQVTIDNNDNKYSVISALINEFKTNPNLNGAAFELNVGDFTSVENCDEIEGTKLLHNVIYPILNES